MSRARRPSAAVLPTIALAGVVVASVACDPSETTPDDAATALTVCTALRETANEVVDAVNASVRGINTRPPAERLDPILAGAADIEAILAGWRERIDRLDLPDGDEGDELRRQLADGVTAAEAELADQRAEFETPEGAVADDEVAGVVGIWFNAVEKVMSSLEPEIFRFERREFKQAFLDEPDCRNVIQQFVID